MRERNQHTVLSVHLVINLILHFLFGRLSALLAREAQLHISRGNNFLTIIKRRNLTEEIVRHAIENAEQHWEVRKGRAVYQTCLKMDKPEKNYLIRVFVDINREPSEIVTAYRTTKIEKYWRK